MIGLSELEAAVLSKIDAKELIRLTRDLIRIPSPNPPGDYQDIVEFLSQQMRKIGLHVRTVARERDKTNLLGSIKGEGKKFLICGHVDTVPVKDRESWMVDPLGAEIRDGRIYGVGACDCKAGLASALTVARIVQDVGLSLKKDLMLGFFVDEETGMEAGSQYVTESGFLKDVKAAIACEPTNMQIKIAFKGRTDYEIVVKGKHAHTSAPNEGINAIHQMVNVITGILRKGIRYKPHELLGDCTLSFTGIEGGSLEGVTSIPERCKAILEVRAVPGQAYQSIKEEIEQIIDVLRSDNPELETAVNILHGRNSFEVSSDEELIRVMRSAIRAVTGKDAQYFRGGGGGGDVYYLLERGVPCTMFGPRRELHRSNEFVGIDELVNVAKIHALTALHMCEASS